MISWILELIFGKPSAGDVYEFKSLEKGNPFEKPKTFTVTVLGYKKSWVKYSMDGDVNYMEYDTFLFCYKRVEK